LGKIFNLWAMNANLTFSNILHRPMRSFVSVLGIAVGVLLIIFTVGLADGTLRGNAQREANVGAEIMVRASGTFGLSDIEPFRLPISRVAELAKIEGVKMVVPLGQNLDSAQDTETGSRLIDGVNYDEYAKIAGLRIIEGRKIGADGSEAVIDTVGKRRKKSNSVQYCESTKKILRWSELMSRQAAHASKFHYRQCKKN